MDALGLIIVLVIAVVAAYACYTIAIRKGRNGPLFAVLGFLFPIIALIVVAVLPSKVGAPSAPPAEGDGPPA